jgi:hypothetical protein
MTARMRIAPSLNVTSHARPRSTLRKVTPRSWTWHKSAQDLAACSRKKRAEWAVRRLQWRAVVSIHSEWARPAAIALIVVCPVAVCRYSVSALPKEAYDSSAAAYEKGESSTATWDARKHRAVAAVAFGLPAAIIV